MGVSVSQWGGLWPLHRYLFLYVLGEPDLIFMALLGILKLLHSWKCIFIGIWPLCGVLCKKIF